MITRYDDQTTKSTTLLPKFFFKPIASAAIVFTAFKNNFTNTFSKLLVVHN